MVPHPAQAQLRAFLYCPTDQHGWFVRSWEHCIHGRGCRQPFGNIDYSIDTEPSQVDAATKLLDKACQKLRGIPDVPPQRIIDLEATIRQLRQSKKLCCSWRTAKAASTSSEIERTDVITSRWWIMPFKIKTSSKNTSALRKLVNIMHPARRPTSKHWWTSHEVWWLEKHHWADSESALSALV